MPHRASKEEEAQGEASYAGPKDQVPARQEVAVLKVKLVRQTGNWVRG